MSLESIVDTTKAAIGQIANSGLTQGAQEKLQAGVNRVENSKILANDGKPLILLSQDSDYSAKGGGTPDDYNIVENYPWTLTPKYNRKNVPTITLEEYEIDISLLYAQLQYWASNLKSSENNSVNPYENLYHAKKTKGMFTFPYFEEYDHQIGQNWEKTKGIGDFSVANKILQAAGTLAKVLQLAPGTTINQPQIWNGSQTNEYTVSFSLFNTMAEGDIAKNQSFKRRLLMSTLHDQRSAILSSPPAIFEVNIPGIRYSPAAVISQLTVSNVGQMNSINGENIPDAYEFKVRILELITESRQILDASVKKTHDIVKAFTKTAPPIDEIQSKPLLKTPLNNGEMFA